MNALIQFKFCIEVYITNECNLTCSNCNRFNNYNFTGHYNWTDSAERINKWAKRIAAPSITIIGGEPSMHPDLESWVIGVANAWPDTPVAIQTNGVKNITNLSWWKSAAKKFPNIGVTVAVHNKTFESKFQTQYNQKQQFDATRFSDCTIIPKNTGFVVHRSTPAMAWGACTMKYCHTLINGLLYRCPVVGLLPEFSKQYRVELTNEQLRLLNSYRPLSYDCSDEDLYEFNEEINFEMEQCSLCPSSYIESPVTFDSDRKKYPKLITVIDNKN